jgi:hypothetical protein
LGSLIINNTRYTVEIKPIIAMAEATFNKKKKTLFTITLGLSLRKKLAEKLSK